jgi:Helix-loop-helix DNA-binding domain
VDIVVHGVRVHGVGESAPTCDFRTWVYSDQSELRCRGRVQVQGHTTLCTFHGAHEQWNSRHSVVPFPNLVKPISLPVSPPMPSAVNFPDILPATAPAKRGRKPGPLSRSAREAQRRLNHSIIEKARRTKINDALATLRQLVPVDYGCPQSHHEDEDEDNDDDDEEYPEGTRRAKPKPKVKGTGKREEKEKEFKLEILVRTVSFLQDLLKRVDTMENSLSVCQHCGANQSSKKRKHSQLHDDDENDRTSKQSKVVPSAEEHPRQVAIKPTLKPHDSPILNPHGSPVSNSHSSPVAPPTNGGSRLPSISSWLPDVPIDPTLLSPKTKPNQSPRAFPYLPSPPASTLFTPTRTFQVPPVLNLGPVATAAMVALPPPHTSEDESAASLLLQIATSPPFHPSTTTISNYLPDPSKFSLHSDVRNQGVIRQPETPRSLLGLHQEREY